MKRPIIHPLARTRTRAVQEFYCFCCHKCHTIFITYYISTHCNPYRYILTFNWFLPSFFDRTKAKNRLFIPSFFPDVRSFLPPFSSLVWHLWQQKTKSLLEGARSCTRGGNLLRVIVAKEMHKTMTVCALHERYNRFYHSIRTFLDSVNPYIYRTASKNNSIYAFCLLLDAWKHRKIHS